MRIRSYGSMSRALAFGLSMVASFTLAAGTVTAAGSREVGLLGVIGQEVSDTVEGAPAATAPRSALPTGIDERGSVATAPTPSTLEATLLFLGLQQPFLVADYVRVPLASRDDGGRVYDFTSGRVDETRVYDRNGTGYNVYHQDGRDPRTNPPGVDVTCYCEPGRVGRSGANPCAAGNNGPANVLYDPVTNSMHVWGN